MIYKIILNTKQNNNLDSDSHSDPDSHSEISGLNDFSDFFLVTGAGVEANGPMHEGNGPVHEGNGPAHEGSGPTYEGFQGSIQTPSQWESCLFANHSTFLGAF